MNWKAEGGFSDSRYDHEGVVGEIKRKEGPCALSEVQHSHMSINIIRTCQTFSASFVLRPPPFERQVPYKVAFGWKSCL